MSMYYDQSYQNRYRKMDTLNSTGQNHFRKPLPKMPIGMTKDEYKRYKAILYNSPSKQQKEQMLSPKDQLEQTRERLEREDRAETDKRVKEIKSQTVLAAGHIITAPKRGTFVNSAELPLQRKTNDSAFFSDISMLNKMSARRKQDSEKDKTLERREDQNYSALANLLTPNTAGIIGKGSLGITSPKLKMKNEGSISLDPEISQNLNQISALDADIEKIREENEKIVSDLNNLNKKHGDIQKQLWNYPRLKYSTTSEFVKDLQKNKVKDPILDFDIKWKILDSKINETVFEAQENREDRLVDEMRGLINSINYWSPKRKESRPLQQPQAKPIEGIKSSEKKDFRKDVIDNLVKEVDELLKVCGEESQKQRIYISPSRNITNEFGGASNTPEFKGNVERRFSSNESDQIKAFNSFCP